MFKIFDTETTGLPLWRDPSDHPQQPHIVQLAYLVLRPDGTEVAAVDRIVKPDGWTIPEEVAAIHGITTEKAQDLGRPAREVMDEYLAHHGVIAQRVAHNVSFDDRLLRIALLRHGLTKQDIQAIEDRPKFCTMQAASGIMKMPPTAKMAAAGFTKPKPPKLAEAIQHFFGEGLPGAHDAMVDVRACGRLFLHLRQREAA